MSGLEGYVLGEAGRPYLVWYLKTTVLISGLSKEEYLSVKITGAGPDTEAVVPIPHEPVPPGEGTITYAFLRLEPLDIADNGPNAGPPGSGGGNGGSGGSGGGQGGSGSGGGNGGGEGCPGCGNGNGNGPGSWDGWGGGNVGYTVGLGGAPGGISAGILRVGVAGDRPAFLSRGSLGVAGYTGVLDVRWNSGVIRQVVAPDAVADVQVTTNGGYEVRVFSRAAVTSTNGAVATFAAGAVPVAVWRVEPDVPGVLDGSRVRLTGTLTNGSVKTTVFIADTNAPSGTIRWTVRSPGDLFDHVTESWTEPGPTNQPPFRLERMAWRWPGGTTNVFVQTRKLAPFSWGWGVVETSVGEGADQKITSTQYWAGSANRRPGGEIALVEEWDGNWTFLPDQQMGGWRRGGGPVRLGDLLRFRRRPAMASDGSHRWHLRDAELRLLRIGSGHRPGRSDDPVVVRRCRPSDRKHPARNHGHQPAGSRGSRHPHGSGGK